MTIKRMLELTPNYFTSRQTEVVCKARSWDCQNFYVGCMTEKLNILKGSQVPVMHLLSQTTSTGHNLKWRHFQILAKGWSDTHCKIKETLVIEELKPTLNDNVSSEKLYLY